jgi:hypothetical protein
LSFGTLNRHLKGQRWKRKGRLLSSASRSVPVELAAGKSPRDMNITHKASVAFGLLAA